MPLLPILFDDFCNVSPSPYGISSCPYEQSLCPVLTQLAHTGKNSTIDEDCFQANLDVQQFKPSEITVKLESERTVVVEGKHEEKADQHGFISRHFVRKYELPVDCDAQKLQSKLSSDGVLSLLAPKIPGQLKSRVIPISLTGPARSVEQKKVHREEVTNS